MCTMCVNRVLVIIPAGPHWTDPDYTTGCRSCAFSGERGHSMLDLHTGSDPLDTATCRELVKPLTDSVQF